MENGKKKTATGTQSLRWFMIQWFLVIMLFVFISEELIGMFYRGWMASFLADVMYVNEVSVTTKEGSILLIVLQQIFMSVIEILPEQVAMWVRHTIGSSVESGVQVSINSSVLDNISNKSMNQTYQFAVVIIYLGLLVVTLLPYAIAAFWYYKIISKKVKELMEEEKRRKEEYDRQRNLLLSDIAHDIKTPITTVCGYARALSDHVVRDEQKREEYLQAIYAKSLRMSDLITLLFEYVKLDSSGFELHKERSDIGELLRENVALLYSDFEEKGIELAVDIPEKKFPFEMDKIQMGRAIGNIMTNMVKYNDKGNKVSVSLSDSYRIRIADNGVPIEDELAEHIFEPFARGDEARSTKGGTGLGLSIASKIVEMHGGVLKLERNCKDGYVKAFHIVLK
ncbi:MAG: HAMP domain-containing histidine kinase [Lachnospiraceae bacterium]|nr:HAMP domain-containing histidine kinase [Lachnospiraceae bacterium]